MGRFESTVGFYERARPPYAPAFFAAVADKLGFNRSERLLDLGTGPGLLAIGFAPFCEEVIGVDPEPGMIEAARAAANRSGVSLRLIAGRAEDLPPDIGLFDIVTIGRALHWMEREPTFAAFERVLAPRGRILICGARSAAGDRNPWLEAYDNVRKRWTPADGRTSYGLNRDVFFEGSRFRRVETISAESEQTIAIPTLADRVLSMSSSSPAKIGVNEAEMRESISDAISPFATDGHVREIVDARAEIFGRE